MQPAKPPRKLHIEILYALKYNSSGARGQELMSMPPRLLTDLYHAMTWPSLSYVAEDHQGRIVGYILAKM